MNAPYTPSNPSLTQSVRDLLHDVTLLVRQEVQLARAEVGEKVDQVQSGLIMMVVGLVFAACALLALVQGLIIAIANFVPPAVAAMAVGIALALIAFAVIMRGRTYLKAQNLAPRRVIASIKTQTDKI